MPLKTNYESLEPVDASALSPTQLLAWYGARLIEALPACIAELAANSATQSSDKSILDSAESFGDFVGVGRSTVFSWIKKGLPSIKVDRVRRIEREKAVAWMAQHDVVAAMSPARRAAERAVKVRLRIKL